MKTKLDYKMLSATGTCKFLLSCEAVTEPSFKKDIVRLGNKYTIAIFHSENCITTLLVVLG